MTAKLTVEDARTIRADHDAGVSILELASRYVMSSTAIGYVVHGKTWPDDGAMRRGQKLTEDQVREIHRLKQSGVGRVELAPRFGVGQSCIAKILAGENWKPIYREFHPEVPR